MSFSVASMEHVRQRHFVGGIYSADRSVFSDTEQHVFRVLIPATIGFSDNKVRKAIPTNLSTGSKLSIVYYKTFPQVVGHLFYKVGTSDSILYGAECHTVVVVCDQTTGRLRTAYVE